MSDLKIDLKDGPPEIMIAAVIAWATEHQLPPTSYESARDLLEDAFAAAARQMGGPSTGTP